MSSACHMNLQGRRSMSPPGYKQPVPAVRRCSLRPRIRHACRKPDRYDPPHAYGPEHDRHREGKCERTDRYKSIFSGDDDEDKRRECILKQDPECVPHVVFLSWGAHCATYYSMSGGGDEFTMVAECPASR